MLKNQKCPVTLCTLWWFNSLQRIVDKMPQSVVSNTVRSVMGRCCQQEAVIRPLIFPGEHGAVRFLVGLGWVE